MNAYPDKYALTPEQSIFLAKKHWDENVYCGMKMEARAVTFPQTRTILNGVNVPGVALDDIQAILNMRDAWRFLISTISEPFSLDYICKLNEYIARNEALVWGKLRTGQVGISGTDYLPPIPVREETEAALDEILSRNTSTTEKALDVFAWCARSQLFWDGNKRTGLTAANKLMLSGGAGMLTITDRNMERFNELLLDFYNSQEPEPLKSFMYENTVIGMVI